MKCDYCKNPINYNGEVFLIRLHNALDWFCCKECRLKFMQEHFVDAWVDEGGHFKKRGDKDVM